jgi:uncharacterized protein YjbJ (UPF0337 family)
MNQEQIKGAVDNLAGKAQQAAGALLDDNELKMEGAAREAGGKVVGNYGDALEGVRTYVERKPFGALAIGIGLGVVLGVLLARRGND